MTSTALLLAVPDDTDKAAPLGLLVLVILGVACYFLFKSMSRHLRRVREDFPVGGPVIGDDGPVVPAADGPRAAADATAMATPNPTRSDRPAESAPDA